MWDARLFVGSPVVFIRLSRTRTGFRHPAKATVTVRGVTDSGWVYTLLLTDDVISQILECDAVVEGLSTSWDGTAQEARVLDGCG